MRKVLVCLFVLFAFAGNVDAETLTLSEGWSLSLPTEGWPDSGLQITALKDVILAEFVFHNQGNQDTIRLEDENGNTLHEYAYAGGEPTHIAWVGWHLNAGETYHLTIHDGDNGRWVRYTGYPRSNEHIQVDGVWQNTTLYKSFWFHFTDIRTVSYECQFTQDDLDAEYERGYTDGYDEAAAVIAGLESDLAAANETIAERDATIAELQATIESMFTQDEVNQIVALQCPGYSEGRGNSGNPPGKSDPPGHKK